MQKLHNLYPPPLYRQERDIKNPTVMVQVTSPSVPHECCLLLGYNHAPDGTTASALGKHPFQKEGVKGSSSNAYGHEGDDSQRAISERVLCLGTHLEPHGLHSAFTSIPGGFCFSLKVEETGK